MKTSFPTRRSMRGFTLIECLVYIAVLGVVLGVGSVAFYRCWDDNKSITRNADDIVRVLKFGEIWRADMRAATGPIKIETANSGQTLHIPAGKKELIYSFTDGQVRKQTTGSNSWTLILPRVKSSRMQIEKRDHVTAWRWEVELDSQRKKIKTRPLFTFEVVPGDNA